MPASDVICAIAFTIASSLPPSTVVHSACAVSPAASAAFPSLAIRHTATTGPAYPSSRSSNACTPVMDASSFNASESPRTRASSRAGAAGMITETHRLAPPPSVSFTL